MDMQVIFTEPVCRFRKQRSYQADRDLGGLFHDIAQLAGHRDLAAAFGQQCLYVEDLTAHGRPGKPCNNTCPGFFFDFAVMDRSGVHIIPQVVPGDCDLAGTAADQFDRRAAAEGVHALFQAAYAAFSGIFGNDRFQDTVVHFQILLPDAYSPHGFGQQMLFGDLHLVQRCISLELDDLHSVQQGLRDSIHRIGRAYEEHIGKVIGNVHVMVCKGTVLFGIQDLQQGAGRISVIGNAQLIHFIQDHDRIGSAALLDAVHDPAGHGADIGPPVAADIRFIPDAAQADPDIFTLQGPGNTLADAGLAGTGRSHKKQDGTGLLAAQVHDRDLLDDPLPDLLQSEMIFFQDSLCFSQINILRFFLFPGKTGQEIQIVIEHTRLCTVTALLTEPVQDFVRFLAGGFVHARFFHFNFQAAQVRDIFRMHFVQLLLQILDLLADGRFLIHLLVTLLLGCLRVIFDGGHLQILIEHLFHHVRESSASRA